MPQLYILVVVNQLFITEEQHKDQLDCNQYSLCLVYVISDQQVMCMIKPKKIGGVLLMYAH